MSTSGKPIRARVYVDGLSLAKAIGDLGSSHLKWFNAPAALRSIASKRGHEIEEFLYFSAIPQQRTSQTERREKYLRALKSEGAKPHLGCYIPVRKKCPNCHTSSTKYEERQVHVHLTCHLLPDVIGAKMDVAYVVTSDIGVLPAIQTALNLNPSVKVAVVCPPMSAIPPHVRDLKCEVIRISEDDVESHLFPPKVKDEQGYFDCPSEYRQTR